MRNPKRPMLNVTRETALAANTPAVALIGG
jgi:hypothetical protein